MGAGSCGRGDLALKPRQCRQQTGRLPSILPVLPILFRALVVAPRGVPSSGVSGQSQGQGWGWDPGQGQGWGRGRGQGQGWGWGRGRGRGRAYSARLREAVPRLASSSSMSEAWG